MGTAKLHEEFQEHQSELENLRVELLAMPSSSSELSSIKRLVDEAIRKCEIARIRAMEDQASAEKLRDALIKHQGQQNVKWAERVVELESNYNRLHASFQKLQQENLSLRVMRRSVR